MAALDRGPCLERAQPAVPQPKVFPKGGKSYLKIMVQTAKCCERCRAGEEREGGKLWVAEGTAEQPTTSFKQAAWKDFSLYPLWIGFFPVSSPPPRDAEVAHPWETLFPRGGKV